VVALGASAGGLESFQKFFDKMPGDTGASFILIQHADPNHVTLMPKLLTKNTAMPIIKVEDGLRAESNKIYVLPPNSKLTLSDGAFAVTKQSDRESNRMPIDRLFRDLAQALDSRMMGIVLSGMDGDGTLGLKAIREAGGLTLAEAPETARHEGMPRSAITAGVVDFILPAEQMSEKIVEYVQHLNRLLQQRALERIQREAPRHLKNVFPILRRQTSHDFSRYKQSTLIRRIQRRIQMRFLDSVGSYIRVLRHEPKEVDALFKDLLIGVTQFFRDPSSFKVLEEKALNEILQGKPAESTVRAWVPGCASGEEAYSIAILIAEYCARTGKPLHAHVFATDLDTEALACARRARYPKSIEEYVSPQRLAAYFIADGAEYEVKDEIRKMCVFSPHNLIKDPPFSRLDLISCRNLLIYLELDLQKRVLALFHYALVSSGFLFLGPSENVASRSELFRAVDKRHRLYQRKPSVLHSSLYLPPMDGERGAKHFLPLPQAAAPRGHNQVRTIERVILEEYAPASVIVDPLGEVIYFSGPTGAFLEPPAGAPSNKLVSMARKPLRAELRSAFHLATANREEVIRPHLSIKHGRETIHFNLVVRPLTELGKDSDCFIVLFQELTPMKGGAAPRLRPAEGHGPMVQQLEHELRSTREDLQTTIEELESSNEDLKSANEELLSMNEELQSTNEEMQTSKEEVLSANDELQRKNDELDAANSDLSNFFQSARVPAVFVDRRLRIKRFTPALSEIFPITERDLGRDLPETARRFSNGAEWDSLIHEVMRTQLHAERQVAVEHGRKWFIVRVNPYFGVDHAVQGAVVTFIDITDLKRAAGEHAQLAAIIEYCVDGIISKDLNGLITSWNKGAERIYGYRPEEAIGQSMLLLLPPELYDEEVRIMARIRKGGQVESFETRRRRKDGSLVDVDVTISPVKGPDGSIIGASNISRDITEKKRTDLALREAQKQLGQLNTELEKQVHARTAELLDVNAQLESLVYSIAHDLRAPLRSMQAFSSILLEDYAKALDAAGRQHAQKISSLAEAMDKLVLDLLAFGQISQSQIKLATVNVADAWAAAISQNERLLRESGARVEIAGDLPPVRGEEATLGQTLANLLSNALKFVRPKVKPVIRLRATRHGLLVRLWVEDNGIGIAPEFHERIFQMFERLRPTEFSGTGIGLAIVRKGIERMGGRTGVESAPGDGSRFWIELPAA
jgi:two-component system CheB/CheR fusion protein